MDEGMTEPEMLLKWIPEQCANAAKKVKGNTISPPLTPHEVWAVAIMADCDTECVVSADGEDVQYQLKNPVVITAKNGRLHVEEKRPEVESECEF
jgi:hypothetical protein